MPITLPNLDDRRYDDLVKEALAIIPAQAPEWTNHNPSDPGITLVELFAYLTEMLIYRLNRVTVENAIAFLNLIDAGSRTPDAYRDPAKLTEEVRETVKKLRKPYRTVTCNDFNEVVTKDFSAEVARAITTTLVKQRDHDKALVDVISVFVVPVSRSTVLVQENGTYREHSSDIRDPGNVPFRLFSGKDDALYIGMESTFDAIKFNFHLTVSGYGLKFEYSRGDKEGVQIPETQWARLTKTAHKLEDLTSNWASSGLVLFAPPRDWQPATVNGKLLYWVRVWVEEKLFIKQDDASAFQVAVQSAPVLQPDESEQSLLKRIIKDLNERRLLATRVAVDGPHYKRIAVRNITLNLTPDAHEANVEKAAKEELSRFFHPLIGGRDGKGWPFGRAVYLSEIIERLVGLPGVDFVESGAEPLQIIAPDSGDNPPPGNSIALERFELVDFSATDSLLKTNPVLDFRAKPASDQSSPRPGR
jgi:hypothetical protein